MRSGSATAHRHNCGSGTTTLPELQGHSWAYQVTYSGSCTKIKAIPMVPVYYGLTVSFVRWTLPVYLCSRVSEMVILISRDGHLIIRVNSFTWKGSLKWFLSLHIVTAITLSVTSDYLIGLRSVH
jgi:hypothetical protein